MENFEAARIVGMLDMAHDIVRGLAEPLQCAASPKKYDAYLTKIATAMAELSDITLDIYETHAALRPGWAKVKRLKRRIEREAKAAGGPLRTDKNRKRRS
ncbi:MAG: hypothetical protein HYR63_07675 [Proteobacteria bacterium]|nr:hypothetical protein [Pseudomonadota bacterium]